MRRFLFQLHSVMGLVAGLCLIVIGLSGSVLVFRQEIESLMMPERVLGGGAFRQAARPRYSDRSRGGATGQLRTCRLAPLPFFRTK